MTVSVSLTNTKKQHRSEFDGNFCWFSICLYQLDSVFFFVRSVCAMLWFVYLNERARDRRQSEQFIVQEAVWHRWQCIHARMTIEISIYSLFNWNGNKPNKAAGISSSLIVTYLFFIFRAIACIAVVSFVHNAVAPITVLCVQRDTLSVHSECRQNLCETPSPFRFSLALSVFQPLHLMILLFRHVTTTTEKRYDETDKQTIYHS